MGRCTPELFLEQPPATREAARSTFRRFVRYHLNSSLWHKKCFGAIPDEDVLKSSLDLKRGKVMAAGA
jgi:hypothetical protein